MESFSRLFACMCILGNIACRPVCVKELINRARELLSLDVCDCAGVRLCRAASIIGQPGRRRLCTGHGGQAAVTSVPATWHGVTSCTGAISAP